MVKSEVTLKVLNPRGEVEIVPTVSASPRLSSLAGKKIGIVINGKTGGEMLLPYVQEAIKKRIPDIEFRKWLVPHQESPVVKEPILKEIAEYADGAIALMGD